MTPHPDRRTRVIRVDSRAPATAAISDAAAVIRSGGLVAFPTETVYGLGANAFDEDAVQSIFSAKERDPSDPLIVHVASVHDLSRVASIVPPLAMLLFERFAPGPLTVVLPRAPGVAPSVSAGLATVAVRIPSHPVARGLIESAGVPVAAPSANRFMRTSATSAAHVLEDLDGRIDLVIDGGPADAGIESTVVSIEGDSVFVLREGALTREEIAAALPPGATIESVTASPAHGSPGMLGRHYAPRKPLTLVRATSPEGSARLAAEIARALAAGEIPGVLLLEEDEGSLAGLAPLLKARLGPQANLSVVASRLYAAMRELDRSHATVLFARALPAGGLGAAVNDRLNRAAARIIDRP